MKALCKKSGVGLGGLFIMLLLACSAAHSNASSWNNPYPKAIKGEVVHYRAFSSPPKHLDPARSYSTNESIFTGQIYEPPLQYHYLKRPYELIPLTLTAMPEVTYLDKQGEPLTSEQAKDAMRVGSSVYTLHIKSGIQYQPHPAFYREANGEYAYHALSAEQLSSIHALSDFKHSGTRELIAADYVYQIKRLAHPAIHSPILGLMSDYIEGLDELSKQLHAVYQQGQPLDLTHYALSGVTVLDRYRYQIRIKGKYPQFLYWLAMPFFAPVPVEADRFYQQAGLIKRNIKLDTYPVGTGPFMMVENNPYSRIQLVKNPNFHGETYPTTGMPEDEVSGLLDSAGAALPLIDRAVYSLEKESIPYWNKFLQGYFDFSGIGSDSFDQAIAFSASGQAQLTGQMQKQGIALKTSVAATSYYMGFNWLDPLVGGNSTRAKKLRQALSIAVNYEEYIAIFMNGRGIAAQGPIPPGIFGYLDGEKGVNPVVYQWKSKGNGHSGHVVRRSLSAAKTLLREAGYPEGRDPSTGKALVVHFDITASGPDDKARMDWMRKQFATLGIELDLRNTDYNRFQDKMIKGSVQMFQWGWGADYPDPENFLFLLYGPNGKAKFGGENAANYQNAEFDRLFDRMKSMANTPERQRLINKMLRIIRDDAPWIFGFHPKAFGLYHTWLGNVKPNAMANNTLKYLKIDPVIRQQRIQTWNPVVVWPIVLVFLLLVLVSWPAIRAYRKKMQAVPVIDNKNDNEKHLSDAQKTQGRGHRC